MKPFLFVRGTKHYARFYIPKHHRDLFSGRGTITFALGAGLNHVIRLKASIIENQLFQLIEGKAMTIDWDNIKKFEIDLNRGYFKANGTQDTSDMLKVLGALKVDIKTLRENSRNVSSVKGDTPCPTSTAQVLCLTELLDKFMLLKKLAKATVSSYTLAVTEFAKFSKKKNITHIVTSDVTQFREHLAANGNSPRTIDGKIGVLKTLFNFAIEQDYLTGKNPAQIKNLLTKKQKARGGYSIFEVDEVKQIFGSSYFKEQQQKDPSYYWSALLVLVTGGRHDEITQLTKAQIKVTDAGTNYIQIRASKTDAGIREVPIPNQLMQSGFENFITNKQPHEKIFKYKAGNALGKKFSRQIKEVHKITRGKLVLHSLRKFLNDFMLKNGVLIEARCQFIGHELDNVNVTTYASKFNVDELHKFTSDAIDKVLRIIF